MARDNNEVRLESVDTLTEPITFNVDSSLLRRLKNEARKDSRSLSAFIRLSLEQYLSSKEKP